MRIDHVIYGTGDLDAAEARIAAELGLSAVPGGRHQGLGTHNRIVPLDDGSYIELLAVADRAEALRSTLGAALLARLVDGDGLMAWSVAVEDLAATKARLGTSVITVRREGMTANLTGLAEALSEPFLPFFIERTQGGSAVSSGGGGVIDWIEVAGSASRLEQWLGGAQLPVRVLDGEPAVRAIAVGDRQLRA